MILFLSDWQKYPKAIADLKTPNKSFIRLAQVYKSMGIKNHLFLLALMQPELQGVDPHSPHLTLEQKVKIGVECRLNPWYFFREVVRLPPVAGNDPIQFLANRGNIALYWSFFNNIDSALIQPRQTGKSASTDCLMVEMEYIAATNTKIMMITKDDALRRANVDRLKAIRDLLPKYLLTLTSKDSDNQFELTCKALGNSYVTGVAQNSEAAANNLGRGLTSPILHCDEGPFINFIGTTLPAALASGTAARDEARKYGRPHGNIFTTTAGKKDDRDGKFMYDLIHSGMVWNEILFDCKNKMEARKLIEQNSSGGAALVNITMSHRQLGKTDEWLRDAIAISRATGEAADRDFLNIWTSGTQRSPLSVALNETIHKSEMEVQHSEISPERYILRWYIPEEEIAERMASGHYVMGLDTSDAVGRDTIALVITDIRDLSVVAVGVYNETNLIRFASYICSLLIKYVNTTLIIERKSSAPMIIDYLLLKLPAMGFDPFKRIFNKIVDEAREKEDAFKEIQRRLELRSEAFYDQRKGKLGFNTTAESRNVLYTTVLQNAAKKAGHLVRDKSLSTEIRGLVEKNGRIDHAASGHDDTVIAWLMTHWLLTHGRNLSYYGINTSDVMAEVTDMGRKLNEAEIQERAQQTAYLDEIDEVLEQLRNARDEIVVMKFEHRLRYLTSKLNSQSLEEVSGLDALLEQAADDRAKRTRIDVQNRRLGQQQQNRSLNFGHQNFTGAEQHQRMGLRSHNVNINYA